MSRDEFPAPTAVRDALRTLATALPDHAVLPVPVGVMLSLLSPEGANTPVEPEGADFSVIELAALFGRAPSTVRGWLERGDMDGAYKLHGRDWRVPRTSVNAFRKAQQASSRRGAVKRLRGAEADLGRWRKRGG